MKKLLSFLTITALSTSGSLPIVNLFLNNNNNLNTFKSSKLDSKNPFLNKMTGIPEQYPVLSNVITSDGVVYAGTDNGLYKSTDGTNFNKVSGIPNDTSIFSVVVLPVTNNIYVGTTNGLYKSTDGTNFNKTKLDWSGWCVALAVAPDGTIWVANSVELYKSTDGENFIKAADLGNAAGIKSILFLENNTILVGCTSGLYKSTDGTNFNRFNMLINTDISLTTAPDGTIWAGTSSTPDETDMGLYKSTDGTNFNKVSGIPNKVNVRSVKVNLLGTIYVGTDHGLYKSTDGTNFNKVSDISDNIYSLLDSIDGNLYIGTDNGLYNIDLLNNVFNFKNKPNYIGKKPNELVYNSEQTFDIINQNYLSNITLDGYTKTIPSTNIDLKPGAGEGYTNGEHTLTVTVKDEYKL